MMILLFLQSVTYSCHDLADLALLWTSLRNEFSQEIFPHLRLIFKTVHKGHLKSEFWL